uniref:Uncharacterized protein n=1 Tax=Tanacetum cinerariifolium TaxID=118510 RepID=A0A6L2KNE9_TANCI|nr:hypothetical protein [Tanacetum cinerariifolium]
MILESVEHDPLIWPTIEENKVIRTKKYAELCAAEKIQADCDMKATNIILQGDDPIGCLNKAIAFLTAVPSLRFPSTNNQLRTSSNPRNQVIIKDGRVIVQQVQGRQGESYYGTGYKSDANSSGGTIQVDMQGLLNVTTVKTEDLNTYDSDCDDISNAKAVLMANISKYGSDVISEVPHSETYLTDMENQSVLAMQDFKQPPAVDFTDNEIHSDSNIILYSYYLQKTQQKAQQIKPTLYDGIVMSDKHVAMHVIDDAKTLILEEESRSRILTKDFGKRFTPQQELSAEQAFWLRMSDPTSKPFDALFVKIEAPKELPKTSLVNESLKKLKFYLAKFDNVVKIMTTPNACRDLLNEIIEVQTVFDQMDDAVQQSSVDKQSQLQDKDSTIYKLKDIIKSLREKSKEENVNYDYVEIETKNVELENSVAKLILKNERLCNEINHVKQELLVYVRDTCPNAIKLSVKKVVVTPKNKVKKVRFAELLTSSSNIKQPSGNKKNDRISQTPSRNMKAIIKEQVKAQVFKIMPQIEKYVTESLGVEVLVRSTNQPRTSCVVVALLS